MNAGKESSDFVDNRSDAPLGVHIYNLEPDIRANRILLTSVYAMIPDAGTWTAHGIRTPLDQDEPINFCPGA